MVTGPSLKPDITEDLPFLLSARAATQVATQDGVRFGVAIGGISFIVAPEGKRTGIGKQAYLRESVPIGKQQFDNSKEAGEQTLEGYWIRSQVSWHHGAGVKFYEPGTDTDTAFRYETSLGVDPWTRGQISLLKKTNVEAVLTAGQEAYCSSAKSPSTARDLVIYNANGILKRKDLVTTTYTTANAPVGRVAIAGSKILYGHPLGIDAVDIDGTTSAALWTQTSGVSPRPFWAKSRIIAAKGPSLYELTLAGGALPATPLYTHPDPLWTWSHVAEAPSSILASGYSGGVGSIFRFTLTPGVGAGATPILSSAFQCAEFPPGEEVHSIRVYLGKYIAIGTSRGVRMGVLDSSDNITYGQLIITTTLPVKSLAARDSYVYAAITNGLPDGTSGVARISLDESIGTGLLFPWAWDAQTGVTGVATSISFYGVSDQVAVGVTGGGLFIQDPVTLVPTGTIRSGRVRYGTIEPKTFRLIDVRSALGTGSVRLNYLDPNGNGIFLAQMDAGSGEGINIDMGTDVKFEYVQFELMLAGNAVVKSVQMKALPSPRRSRQITYPLMCMDRETDYNGQQFGTEGYAWDRVQALEQLEQTHTIVTIQDFRSGEVYSGMIDSLKYENLTPPSRDSQNWGGYIWVTARKL